ncbi:MAG: tetratricopeptide repeat protein [Bryobacteraceae bacterium]
MAALTAAVSLLALASCSRPGSSGLTRVGIVPATLLTTESALGWAGIGLAVVAYQDLATSHKYVPLLVGNDSMARQAQAKYILRSTVETRNGKFVLTATLTDLATQKELSHASVEGMPVEGFVTLANQLMKRIDPGAGEFSTKNDNALAAYAQGLSTSNSQQKMAALGSAIEADPGFGLAYLTLMDSLNAQDQQQLSAIAGRADKFRTQFVPLDRARLDVVTRRLSGASPAEIGNAISAVLALSPGDVSSLMMLAQLRISENKPDEAMGRLREVLSLDATNLQARQLLAAALLNTRQEGEAIKTIEDLRALRPEDPNVARTLAEIQFSTGHIAEAEKTFRSTTEPSAAVGVAICRLLAGDPAGANMEVEKYAASRKGDPLLPFTRATFLAAEGERAKAIAMLTSTELAGPELHSVGLSQSAIYEAMAKNFAASKQLADAALPLATARVPKIFSIVASLVARGDESPAQFEALVQASPMDPNGKKITSGYGYFVAGRYDSALPLWQQLLQASPGDVHAQLMVAACENRLGKTAEAVKAAPRMFLPNFSGGDQFSLVTFGEMLRIKAATAQLAGDTKVAEQYNKLVAMYKL